MQVNYKDQEEGLREFVSKFAKSATFIRQSPEFFKGATKRLVEAKSVFEKLPDVESVEIGPLSVMKKQAKKFGTKVRRLKKRNMARIVKQSRRRNRG